jgi:hypothetical protein
MAAFDPSAFIGNRNVRPTEDQLATIEQWEAGLGDAAVQRLWRHLQYFTQHLHIAATINGGADISITNAARMPFKLVALDVGCEAAAASADADLLWEPAGSTPGFTSLLEAVVDIQATAGVYDQSGQITDGKEDIAYGDKFHLSVTAGAGNCTGAQALLHCFRL